MSSTPPVPDPTILTTEQLLREVNRVKELLHSEVDGLKGVIDERFDSVDRQFTLVEQQRVEQKVDTKSAVDAALIAQKEAVREQTTASERAIAKSEAATTKQLEQLTVTFTTAIGGVTELLSDLKERVGRIESIKAGAAENRTDSRATVGTVTAIIGAALAILAALLLLFSAQKAKSSGFRSNITAPVPTLTPVHIP